MVLVMVRAGDQLTLRGRGSPYTGSYITRVVPKPGPIRLAPQGVACAAWMAQPPVPPEVVQVWFPSVVK